MISSLLLQKLNTWGLIGRASLSASILTLLFLLCIPMPANANEILQPSVPKTFAEQIKAAKAAGVQQDVLLLVTQGVIEKRIDRNSASCLIGVVLTAKEARLPASVLEEKIREGCAKGIQSKRIYAALLGMVEKMKFSKQLLTRYMVTPPEGTDIRMMHEALSQGVTHDQADDFFSSRSKVDAKTVLEAFRLYALLGQSGVSTTQLDEFLTLIIKDEAVMNRWKELPQLFAIVTRDGVSPNVFMHKAILAVKAGISPRKFARELSLRPRSLGVSEEK